ncbi:MAG: urease accessory UreF family protein, partial [Pseudomonadota bacterium]
SSGLETAIADGHVSDAETLKDWLLVLITQGNARQDAGICALSHRGEDMTALARALTASRERAEEAEAQGAAFARTLAAMGCDVSPAPLPVAVGQAARNLDVSTPEVAALYLQSYIGNLVTVAVRAIPLGQSDGQRVLGELAGPIADTADWGATATPDGLGSASFGADMAAMRHEVQEVRIYRT